MELEPLLTPYPTQVICKTTDDWIYLPNEDITGFLFVKHVIHSLAIQVPGVQQCRDDRMAHFPRRRFPADYFLRPSAITDVLTKSAAIAFRMSSYK